MEVCLTGLRKIVTSDTLMTHSSEGRAEWVEHRGCSNSCTPNWSGMWLRLLPWNAPRVSNFHNDDLTAYGWVHILRRCRTERRYRFFFSKLEVNYMEKNWDEWQTFEREKDKLFPWDSCSTKNNLINKSSCSEAERFFARGFGISSYMCSDIENPR